MLGFLILKNLGKPACTCFVYFDSKNKSIDAENWVMCLVQLRWTSGRQQFSRDEDAQKRAVSYTFTQKKKNCLTERQELRHETEVFWCLHSLLP